jgi:transcriptional regulator with GAF, ATPase, and Fis domain
MSVPLMAGESLVGVLTLYTAESEGFNDDRGRLIQMIAPHLATALSAAGRHVGTKTLEHADKPQGPQLRLVSAR